MARIQTRRTISFSREFYEQVKRHAFAEGRSMSSVIEGYVMLPALIQHERVRLNDYDARLRKLAEQNEARQRAKGVV